VTGPARTYVATRDREGRTVSWAAATLGLAVLTTGLMAGLFAAFAYAVMPGLARGSDRSYVEAMQGINVAILNGWFGICFGGALVFAVLAAVLHRGSRALPWIVAGAVLYLLVLVVTMAANVPLNDRLEAAKLVDPTAARAAFEDAWVRWNVVRTVLNLAAFASLAWACRLTP
jgi:uncharacterized membrane protein